jgi:hypothetical protein
MYVFLIDIPFNGSQSLAKITSKVTAVSYLHSGVNDSAVHVTAELMTRCDMHGGVNDSTVHATAASMTPQNFFKNCISAQQCQ